MRNIKLTIEYDGTDLAGWQTQSQNNRTVQGEIEKALKTIFKKKIHLIGSGRTDAGVHALGQVANFKTDAKMATEEITRALNGNLPADIVILKAQEISSNFHAQYSAKRKTYRYTILNRRQRPALQKNFCLHIPYKLNLSLMKKAAKDFVGRKDFRSFMASGSESKKDTTRTIYKISLRKIQDFILIDITANGFLYKMVRNIVGTLLDIGSGKIDKNSVKAILKQKTRLAAGVTAPAKGLSLIKVEY